MAIEKKGKQTKAQIDKQNSAPVKGEKVSTEDFPNELRERLWSVISFEKLEASGLTYMEAEEKLSALEANKVSGLCIVTDEAAARISNKG